MGQSDSTLAEFGLDGMEVENISVIIREYAEAALEYFNNQGDGKQYEFVEHGRFMAREPMGPTVDQPNLTMDRLNFTGKEKDCPSAPDVIFSAKLSFVVGLRVDSCECLGPNHELPRLISRI